MPNFVEISQTAAEIWPFYDCQDGGRRHLGFVKFTFLTARTVKRFEISSCQISSISVELRPRYGDFLIFQDGGVLKI